MVPRDLTLIYSKCEKIVLPLNLSKQVNGQRLTRIWARLTTPWAVNDKFMGTSDKVMTDPQYNDHPFNKLMGRD